jgi:hypothetical protein
MTINLKNVPEYKVQDYKQTVFKISTTALRSALSDVLHRVCYCNPPHTAYIVKRGDLLVGVIKNA